ncbi:MAG: methylated-DNA--[protein]-cysteine S-methyltransferase [Bacteroidales bacterium]|nr:methylated-DNA--[protein]-cysteine S-methyltransferase [Bacteroidales bacterium]
MQPETEQPTQTPCPDNHFETLHPQANSPADGTAARKPEGAGEELSRTIYHSPLGPIVLEGCGGRLTGLRFEEDDLPPEGEGEAMLDEARRWLDCYFDGRNPEGIPPLRLVGTAFQQRVWQELLRIPYGRTVSYGQLAERIGCRSAQAVGGAVGRNPVAIIVPCHRVVGADGTLTGFAYGLERKRWLLTHEAQTTIAT